MAHKKIRVKVTFSFEGWVEVDAGNYAEAEKEAEQHFGLVMGGEVQSTSDKITNWEFPIHPSKFVRR